MSVPNCTFGMGATGGQPDLGGLLPDDLVFGGITESSEIRSSTGNEMSSICLAKCTVSPFHVGYTFPQNLQFSSVGCLAVILWQSSTICHTLSKSSRAAPPTLAAALFLPLLLAALALPAALAAAFWALGFGSTILCSRTRC